MLKKKEIALIDIIQNIFQKENRYPSYGELTDLMGYKSKQSISVLVKQLIEKDILTKSASGGIRLKKFLDDSANVETVDVPLIGEISCGIPIFAEENIETLLSISTKIAKPTNKYFLLRAIGDSMNKPKCSRDPINEGDLVLVSVQSAAENGDWVVALVNNEATIKEYHKKSDHVILMPRSNNPKNKPIILTEDFRIQGVVKTSFSGLGL